MTAAQNVVVQIFVFWFGTIVGSFVNVCIFRIPRDLRITAPRSRCARCGTVVAWYDNIPIASYIILRGRCRHCGTAFGAGHLIVEVLLGLSAWWIFQIHGVGFTGLYLFSLTAALVAVSGIDLTHRIIPDEISLNGIWIGIAVAALASWLGFPWFVTWNDSLLGALVGGVLPWSAGTLYEKITDREGLGFGDVKLLAFFGANAGVYGVLVSLCVGAFLGSVVGVYLILFRGKGRRTPIPFGPFLVLGLLMYALGGGTILMRMIRF
ncbi:MAG: prepilin peptidase [Pseudomonadota bacterium]